MKHDPIVHEIRTARERHAASFHYDLKAIFADFKRTERARGKEPLPPPQRGPVTADPSLQMTRFARR